MLTLWDPLPKFFAGSIEHFSVLAHAHIEEAVEQYQSTGESKNNAYKEESGREKPPRLFFYRHF